MSSTDPNEKWNAYHRTYIADKRAAWKAAGLCASCGHDKERAERTYCDRCIKARSDSRRKSYAKKKKRRAKSRQGSP